MKKRELIHVLIFCFCSMISYAQTKLEAGKTIKTQNYEYMVSASFNQIGVINMKGKYEGRSPITLDMNRLPIEKKDIHFNDTVQLVVNEVLGQKLALLKEREEIMRIKGIFNQDGTLIEVVYFSFKDPTIITIEDIDAIQKRLELQTLVIFSGNEYKEYPLISLGIPLIRF